MLFRWLILLLPLLLLSAPAYSQDAEAERPEKAESVKLRTSKPQDAKVETPKDKASEDAKVETPKDKVSEKTKDKTEAKVKAEDAKPKKPEKPLTERQKRELAAKAREDAELRIEEDMVTMTSLVEALSKNLGQIHYLRTLCFGPNDQKWRDYGKRMMTVESNGDKDRHRQLVRAFNAGYYQEKERHSKCSQKVSVDVAALAENGRHISSMLGDPYRER